MDEVQEFNDALLGLRNEVVDLKSVLFDTNYKMSKAMNDSHIKSAMTMLDSSFYFRSILDRSSNPNRRRQTETYF